MGKWVCGYVPTHAFSNSWVVGSDLFLNWIFFDHMKFSLGSFTET